MKLSAVVALFLIGAIPEKITHVYSQGECNVFETMVEHSGWFDDDEDDDNDDDDVQIKMMDTGLLSKLFLQI